MANRIKKKAYVYENYCVACGMCAKVCPTGAISVFKGIVAKVNTNTCVGCGICEKSCTASVITIKSEDDL